MDSEVMLLSAAFLLALAGSLIPKSSRDYIGGFFGSLQNQITQASSGTSAAVQAQSAQERFDYKSLPSNRTLTVYEVFGLAEYVSNQHFGGAIFPILLTAMAFQESSYNPQAIRQESRGRASVGLMQTLVGTAQEMYGRGYRAVGMPTEQTLKTPYVSMYFGAAYVDHLFKNYPGKFKDGTSDYYEWYIRAYNGGQGWENSTAGRNMTAVHYSKIKAHMARISREVATVTVGG